jgi:flagellum-specific peptidoglycan hydrolase FlgJ
MRRNYWKECCLLLIGMFIGTYYGRYITPITTCDVISTDTIVVHDTIKQKIPTIPPLNAKKVLKELKKQNIPHAEIVLAQSKLETGGYTSKLCKTHNNIFGIRKNNKYKRYSNYIACIADYKKHISSKYKGGDYYLFLERLGYAEDPEYTKKLKNIV